MADNKKYIGEHLTLSIANASSSDPVIKGKITGVALGDTDADGEVVVDTKGIYNLSVEAINDDGNSAISIGDKIYFEAAGDPVLNKKKTGVGFGYAFEAIGTGETDTIMVLLGTGVGDLSSEKVYITDSETLNDDLSSDDGKKIVRSVKATYDITGADDGAVGVHGLGVSVPANAIVLDGMVDVQETLTDGAADSATAAIHIEDADDIIAAVDIATVGDAWDQGLHDVVPVGTAATAIKTTGVDEVTLTISVAEVTAGKLTVLLKYVLTEVDVA